MSIFKKTRRMPRWLNNLLCIAAAVLLCTGLYALDNREINPDNLIKVENYSIKTEKTTVGIDVDVKEDGRISLSGKATADYKAAVVTLQLNPGEYTLGGCKSQIGKSGLVIEYNGSEHYAGIDGDKEGATFTITEDQGSVSATVYVFVDEDVRVLQTIEPTLAKGDEEISFYK